MFRTPEILERLTRLESRLTRIEGLLTGLETGDRLRAELDDKRKQLEELSQQGLHVVELLDQARKHIAHLEQGGQGQQD